MVEHGRHFRMAGVLEHKFVGFQFGIRGIYTQNRLEPVPITILRINWRPMDIRHTLGHKVELLDHETLVLVP